MRKKITRTATQAPAMRAILLGASLAPAAEVREVSTEEVSEAPEPEVLPAAEEVPEAPMRPEAAPRAADASEAFAETEPPV